MQGIIRVIEDGNVQFMTKKQTNRQKHCVSNFQEPKAKENINEAMKRKVIAIITYRLKDK